MKEGIHPKYVESTVTCACGYSFKTRSTLPVISLNICSQCHPFFTGTQKLIDTAGRVERFQKRFVMTEGKTIRRAKKVIKKKAETVKRTGKILSSIPHKAKKAAPAKKEKK
jgi:large subunit ribosomal protein L31